MNRLRVVLSVLLLAVGSSVFAGPELTLQENWFDFGITPQHSFVSHKFLLKSTGDTTVQITRIVPGCACTKAPLEKDQLPAGDSTYMEIVFNSYRYTGLTERTPRFFTGDTGSSEKEHIITYRATVTLRPDSTYPLIIYPYKLDMTPIGTMTRDKIKFTITNASDQDLTLTMVAEPTEVGTVTLPQTIKAKSEANGVMTLSKEGTSMEFEKSFTFSVSDSAKTRFTVPVKRFASAESAKKATEKANQDIGLPANSPDH
jgi:hypothetical protein